MSKAIKVGQAVMVKRNADSAHAGAKGIVTAKHRGQSCIVDFGHIKAALLSCELVAIVSDEE